MNNIYIINWAIQALSYYVLCGVNFGRYFQPICIRCFVFFSSPSLLEEREAAGAIVNTVWRRRRRVWLHHWHGVPKHADSVYTIIRTVPVDRKFSDFTEYKDLISSENVIYYLETSS